MNQVKQAIERGIDLYRELVGEDEALEAELEASRHEFHGGGGAPGGLEEPLRILAERRHLEWFLLERPSAHLDGVPVQVLQDAWFERAGAPERRLSQAFLQSLAGAFEVTSSEPGRGVWVADLFGLGEIPIEEQEAAPELLPGDLLVGRLFPIGEGVYRLSPAMTSFRNPRLLEAVRGDLQRMRESRRGVLRVQQLELESLFFTPLAGPAPSDRETPAAAQMRIHSELVEAGLSPADAAGVIETVRDAPRTPGLVTEILNELAFDTDVDLERTRKALAELWSLQEMWNTDSGAPASPSSATTAAVATSTDTSGDARAALAKFDQGRAAGRDLEQLFAELAANLGVEPPSDDDDDGTPLDFPGVVGAMVEEFLWDVGREKGEPTAERYAALRRFSEYGKGLGVFENLGQRELVDFAGRWLLDEGDIKNTEEVRALFEALEEFCLWCKERHAHDLWTPAEASLTRLRRDVPRLLLLRQRIRDEEAGATPFRVLAVNGGRCQLAAPAGDDCQAVIPEEFHDLIEAGDVIHARVDDDGVLHPQRAYPAELERLLPNDPEGS